MKTDLCHYLFALAALIAAGAAEETLWAPCAVAFPLLLAAALWFSRHTGIFESILVAVAAGAMADALHGWPPATGIAFFTLVALAMRLPHATVAATVAAYPLLQLWLPVWGAMPLKGLLVRFALSLPLGIVTVAAVWLLLGFIGRKAGVDEKT